METATPFIQGSHSLLKTAANKLKENGYISLRLLSDSKGVFSIEYPKFFLNAKEYFYHNSIISIQKEMVHRANIIKKNIVIYVAQNDTFYIFNPQDIIDNHFENIKGDPGGYHLVMYNWDRSLGREMKFDV